MSKGIVCRQPDCRMYAFYKYTWPGEAQSTTCVEHAGKLRAKANTLVVHLELIPITPAEHDDIHHPLARSTMPASRLGEEKRR